MQTKNNNKISIFNNDGLDKKKLLIIRLVLFVSVCSIKTLMVDRSPIRPIGSIKPASIIKNITANVLKDDMFNA